MKRHQANMTLMKALSLAIERNKMVPDSKIVKDNISYLSPYKWVLIFVGREDYHEIDMIREMY